MRAALIVIGPQGLGRWQALEVRSFVQQAVERRTPVIPVLLPGVAEIPADLLWLRQLHCVRFSASLDEAAPMSRLLAGIASTPQANIRKAETHRPVPIKSS